MTGSKNLLRETICCVIENVFRTLLMVKTALDGNFLMPSPHGLGWTIIDEQLSIEWGELLTSFENVLATSKKIKHILFVCHIQTDTSYYIYHYHIYLNPFTGAIHRSFKLCIMFPAAI